MRDPLTQLYNQRAFYEELEKNVEISNRTETHMTLLYIDLNKFKEVNDQYGHRAGDEVLVAFAKTANQVLRKSETASRYGGDEFCIIMPNTEIEKARHLCERLGERFTELVKHNVTLSIGGASIYPNCGYGFDRLIQLADAQMYQAKKTAHKSGKNESSLEARKDDGTVTKLA
jgi:diguanylate cyclase (GGDEF)-like protein